MSEQIKALPGYFRTLLAVLMLGAAGLANAVTVTAVNGTFTTFDVSSGVLSFDWDQDSQYTITGTSVALNDFDIVIPGVGHVGTIYEFIIPNFYDPLPLKTIEVTMFGDTSGGILPEVTSVVGADSDYVNGGPAIMVEGIRVADSIITSGTVSEFWEIYPNPDYETIDIYVPSAFQLSAITIETQSTVVPVPAALWLMTSGLLVITGFSRRSRKNHLPGQS